MSKLNWKLLTKKRGSSTQGLPPGKEDLAWAFWRSAWAPPRPLPLMSPGLALSTYEARAVRQSGELASYSATTVVCVELPQSSQHGEFKLERHYAAPRSLEFKAVQFTGDNFVKGNVITRLLQSEVDHVQKDDPALTAITTANYKFSYKATLMIQVHDARVPGEAAQETGGALQRPHLS
jgi:hypothetical protein